jgi:hypothetical protein
MIDFINHNVQFSQVNRQLVNMFNLGTSLSYLFIVYYLRNHKSFWEYPCVYPCYLAFIFVSQDNLFEHL